MRKRITHNKLAQSPRRRRRAFSLAELVVSMGILVLMLSLAGQVMSLTVKSTGQAKALTETNQQLRVFERTLIENLSAVQPGRSLLLIQGNPINAFWTNEHRDAAMGANPRAGYPHPRDPERTSRWNSELLEQPRADLLMFFAERPGTSKVSADISVNLQQVVIGHVNAGEYRYDAATNTATFTPDPLMEFPTDNSTTYPVAAEGWHLGLRQVMLSPATRVLSHNPNNLSDPMLLRGETDVMEAFNYETQVLTPEDQTIGGLDPWHGKPYYLPPMFDNVLGPFSRSQVDLSPPPPVAYGVNQFFLPRCASFKVEWCLDPDSKFVGGRLEGEREVYWIDMGDLGTYPDPAVAPDSLRSLREAASTGPPELYELLTAKLGGTGVDIYSLEDRFGGKDSTWTELSGGIPNLAVFTARLPKMDANGNPIPGEYIPDDVFPAALRITIDVYDRERRLDRPIRHVIVAPVGS